MLEVKDLLNSASVRCVLEGRSFIDARRLNIVSREDARQFLACYGFRLEDETDRLEIQQIYREALALIHEDLLDEGEAIPLYFLEHADVLDMLCAINPQQVSERSLWSCSILRVMHTLAHSSSYLNDRFQAEIREQILSPFTPHLHQNEGHYYLGDLELEHFDCRPAKSRRSVALKLLHKAENVAADIFDWIGLRFITRSRFDVLRALVYLRQKNLVMFANIKPSRSRNTLLDLPWITEQLEAGKTEAQIEAQLQLMAYPGEETCLSDNPYSETAYHSVQFTARQRISILTDAGQKRSFFFPFEIQLMDKDSYAASRSGLASHDRYKKRQKQAIRRRIFPQLFEAKGL